MKILLDTNVILDFALERQPFFNESEQVMALVEQNKIEGYVSASTYSDLYYLIRKAKSRELALDFLQKLNQVCQVATVDETVITIALTANLPDFEDAIQYSAATVNELEAIVTRNTQDYPNSTINIFTPGQLIENYP
ncbi:MAG: PIN domain-containing protein [Oscillatoria sp. PMC 1051.18]|nr:PIN domain-containing protein [Oscillatoria sp. PMC 1050.18]MEC5028696.1 PIN domain-containing protein [Oscillatoria sp. PMC 1051.18]